MVAGKSPRRVAQEKVGAYHEACLGELVGHVAAAVDRFRAGELDAFEVDRVLFQYGRAAKDLCKFCNYTDIEFAASLIDERRTLDWWAGSEPRQR